MVCAKEDYGRAAVDRKLKLKEAFKNHTIFWQLGHAFDTMHDCFVWNNLAPEPMNFAKVVLNKYLNRHSLVNGEYDTGRDPWWYDDYGWWGIAALRASRAPKIWGEEYADYFEGIADLCWQPMFRNAPYVWKNADQNFFKDYAPKFRWGVWNWLYSRDEIYGIPFTPSIPGMQDGLRGIQNTVTNGLYWVLTARLFHATGNSYYSDVVDKILEFLRLWFSLDNDDYRLLNFYDSGRTDKAVVRERVGLYASGNVVPGYRANFAWTGDQGLVLGGLVDQMKIVGQGSEYAALLDLAKKILAGVKDHLSDPKTQLLRPWAPYTDPDNPDSDHGAPGGDVDDYMTGVAVFMRYLLYAFQTNADLKSYMATLGYRDWVCKNADYVLKHPADATKLIYLTNDLATLVTAVWMS